MSLLLDGFTNNNNMESPNPKSPSSGVDHRSYKACIACRARKVRCVGGDKTLGVGCLQCRKDDQRCIFEAKRRAYDTSSRTRKAQEKRAKLTTPAAPLQDNRTDQQSSVQSSAEALLFLSDAAARHGSASKSPSHYTNTSVQHDICYPQTPASQLRCDPGVSTTQDSPSNQIELHTSPWDSHHVQSTVSSFRCCLFRESIILPHEAIHFVLFFFRKLYPFFPFVPDAYYSCVTSPNPDLGAIRPLFDEDEILLGCIITVSSRYYHLPADALGGYERSCDIHNRCWHWTRSQISRVLFEGCRPKSLLSVIEALLMLAEWLPKPIHAFIDNNELRSHPQRDVSAPFDSSQLILQPAFRTDHVSWSYVGNAFLILRSLTPGRRICPIFQTHNRYLITLFSCLIMSQSLARRLGRSPLMSFQDVDLTQISQAFKERNIRLQDIAQLVSVKGGLSLGISESFHDAFVELMRLLARAQEVLHPPAGDGIVKRKDEIHKSVTQYVALMQHFDNLNRDWESRHAALFQDDALGMSDFSKLMLKADFEYLRIYEFSSSLGAWLSHGESLGPAVNLPSQPPIAQGNDWDFPSTSIAYYLEQAIDSAEILLRLMLGFRSTATEKTLRYASSRHYMKIVFAAAFLIQTLRTGIPSGPFQDSLTTTLNTTITALEDGSIDAAHPAFRYSILLRSLMNDLQKRKRIDGNFPGSLAIGQRKRSKSLSQMLTNASNENMATEGHLYPEPRGQSENYLNSGSPNYFAPSNQPQLPNGYEGVQFTAQMQERGDLSEEWDPLEYLDDDTFLQSLMDVNPFLI